MYNKYKIIVKGLVKIYKLIKTFKLKPNKSKRETMIII